MGHWPTTLLIRARKLRQPPARLPPEEPLRPPYMLLDIDGVLMPFPDAEGSTPATHVRHDVVPTGRSADTPVTVWLDPDHGAASSWT